MLSCYQKKDEIELKMITYIQFHLEVSFKIYINNSLNTTLMSEIQPQPVKEKR